MRNVWSLNALQGPRGWTDDTKLKGSRRDAHIDSKSPHCASWRPAVGADCFDKLYVGLYVIMHGTV